MTIWQNSLRSYAFTIILMASIILGGATGYCFGAETKWLKPLGDIFLNLMLTTLVPLIFFNVSSAIARIGSVGKLGRIFSAMAMVFIFTGIVAASLTLLVMALFPPAQGVALMLDLSSKPVSTGFLNHITGIFTVTDFSKLLSHEHMLALIVFAILVGLAASSRDDTKNNSFVLMLKSGEEVFMRVFSLIMLYAPIGFFAYFATLISELGPALVHSYVRVALTYYIFAIAYFIFAYTAYAYIAGNTVGITLFWKNVFLPAATAIATCSSAASIPANLVATSRMHVSTTIVETAIPLGSIIHKDGSVIGGVVKIAFLFGLFHLQFSGMSVLLTALGVSLLVGTVMGAIPSGGMLGELLILTAYGLPPSALIAIAAISIIIDPIATMLNVTGNSVSAMMVARLVDGKKWLRTQPNISTN